MNRTPDCQDGNDEDGIGNADRSKTQGGPQQKWQEGIKKYRGFAYAGGNEGEIAQENCPGNERSRFEMVGARFS